MRTLKGSANALEKMNEMEFVSVGDEGEVRLWRNEGEYVFRVLKRMRGHQGKVCCVCRVDEKVIATGGEDGCIRVWDTAEGRCVGEMTGHKGKVNGVVKSGISEVERMVLISVGDDANVMIWNLNKKECIGEIQRAHVDKVVFVKEVEDGKILTAGENGVVKVWV